MFSPEDLLRIFGNSRQDDSIQDSSQSSLTSVPKRRKPNKVSNSFTPVGVGRMTQEQRDARVRATQNLDVAESTRDNRERSWNRFRTFCKESEGFDVRMDVFPVCIINMSAVQQNNMILRFFDWLIWDHIRGTAYKALAAERKLKNVPGTPATANNYVSLLFGYCRAEFAFEFTYNRYDLAALVAGTRRKLLQDYGPRELNRKEPMHPKFISAYIDHLEKRIYTKTINLEEATVRAAMCTLAFTAMFRKSEFSQASTAVHDPRVKAARHHVTWHNQDGTPVLPQNLGPLKTGSYALIRSCPTKNDQYGENFLPIIIPFNRDAKYSAGFSLWRMELQDPCWSKEDRQVPLFRIKNNRGKRTWVKGALVDQMVIDICKVVGTVAKRYGSHSFRHGGAAVLHAMGASDETIRTMGRWKSDAWKTYARVNFNEVKLQAEKMMYSNPQFLTIFSQGK